MGIANDTDLVILTEAKNLLFIGSKKQILRTCAPEEVPLGDGLRMTILRCPFVFRPSSGNCRTEVV